MSIDNLKLRIFHVTSIISQTSYICFLSIFNFTKIIDIIKCTWSEQEIFLFLANIFSRSDKIRFACTKSNLICNFKRVITIEQYCNSNDSLKTLKRQRYFFLQWQHIFSSYYYLLIRLILVRFQEVLYFAFYNLE